MSKKHKSDRSGAKTDTVPLGAIALIGASTLLIEILLTRIFSVTMWYHFAFVAISLALFGIAASGVCVTIAPRLFRSERALSQMGDAAALMGAAITICFLIDLQIPLEPFDLPGDAGAARPLRPYFLFLAKFLVLSLPFFFSGLVIALAFTQFPRSVYRTYFADLAGGGVGCALVVPSLLFLSGPSAVIAASALALLASALLFRSAGRVRAMRAALIGVLGIILIVGTNEITELIRITRVKSYSQQEVQTLEPEKLYERWHPVSRVAVFEGDSVGPRPWFYSSQSRIQLPQMLSVTNDAGARTYIYAASSPERLRRIFSEDLSDLAYHISQTPDVLVIGVGGGKDILAGLAMGASTVTGVELNPLMIEVVQDIFSDFSGRPYDDPRVRIVIGEGRNYIASRNTRYDFIKISVTDTWTASALGAYALTENYLYTVEAIKDFVSHLQPDGLLSIIRWFPQESLRLAALSAQALREMGHENPYERIAMVRNLDTVNLTIKNGPFTETELQTLQHAAESSGLIWVGGGSPQFDALRRREAELSRAGFVWNRLHRRAVLDSELAEIQQAAPFSIAVPTDDRPFFFSPVGLGDAQKGKYFQFKGFTFQHGRALGLLVALLKLSLTIAVAFVLLPLLLWGGNVLRGVPIGTRIWSSLYFSMLGFGYLLIEVPMLQQFILFLGHPTYAVTVVLFSLLVSSGLGSLLAGACSIGAKRALRQIFPGLLLLVFAYAGLAPTLLHALIGLPLAVRILIAIAMIVPMGLLLGVPFPAGVRELHRISPKLVPWAWAVNGAASVAAPVIAMIVGIMWGFSWALYLGASAYLFAALFLWALQRSGAPAAVHGKNIIPA